MFIKVEYCGMYPLGSDMELDTVPIMQGEWRAYGKPAVSYGKKNIVSPFLEQIYYVTHKNRTVFFAAIEYGLGHYHIFRVTPKANEKLTAKIKKQAKPDL